MTHSNLYMAGTDVSFTVAVPALELSARVARVTAATWSARNPPVARLVGDLVVLAGLELVRREVPDAWEHQQLVGGARLETPCSNGHERTLRVAQGVG